MSGTRAKALEGIFAQWQPLYAERGIATFPVREKRPAVSGYLKIGLRASGQFAIKFPTEDSFGLACRRSGITVLDVDAPDERLLADAMSELGPSPFVVRSGSGNFQAWYKHNGEKRRVRPDPLRPIDILGDGFVVAPPSIGTKGSYKIISGSLDDLANLPPMRRVQQPTTPMIAANAEPVREGRRNDALWRQCMARARGCSGVSDLMEAAMAYNSTAFYEPLPDDEVLKVVASAWAKEISGQNWFGTSGRVVLEADEIDRLGCQYPDAFILLAFLKRHHWNKREFFVANAMAESIGQTRKRFAAARRQLETFGEIRQMKPATRHSGPAVYQFKGGQI